MPPQRTVLLIGINDLLFSRYEDPLGAKLDRYEALVIRLRKRLPQTQLCLLSLLPTGGDFADVNPKSSCSTDRSGACPIASTAFTWMLTGPLRRCSPATPWTDCT